MHPYVMEAEDSEKEFQKYLEMGVGSRLVANAIGIPMGLAMGAMLWGTYLSLLVFAYTCFGIINSILILLLVFIYGTLLPVFLITYSIANIILDLDDLIEATVTCVFYCKCANSSYLESSMKLFTLQGGIWIFY